MENVNNSFGFTFPISEIAKQIAGVVKSDILAEIKQMTPPEYVTGDDVCKKFQITKTTLHEWKNKGIIKGFKIGGRVYYRLDLIEKEMIEQ